MARVSAEQVEAAKATVLQALAEGETVAAALARADRTQKTYEYWVTHDLEFRAKRDRVRAELKSKKTRRAKAELNNAEKDREKNRDISFVDFRKKYLDYDTYVHQEVLIAAAQGTLTEIPPELEGCEWKPRDPDRVIINIPPFHAKSQTLTIDWVTYLICMDPNVRVAIISKRLEQAKKFLYAIKQRLISNLFVDLQAAFAPDDGFRPADGTGAFSASTMYVAGRTADHKDPTVEALGIGGQIYGSRFDVIIVDDAIVSSNANEYEKQINWLIAEVDNRVDEGKVIIIGTRLAQVDLYSEIQRDERYGDGESPWSYLRMPMVLKFAENVDEWRTLWPWSTTRTGRLSQPDPETGLYMAPGHPQKAAKKRAQSPPSIWSLVYQQRSSDQNAIFKELCVLGSIDRRRSPGPLRDGALGSPQGGRDGMWVIASMDPATTGDCFTVVGCIDKVNMVRWIENAWIQSSPHPTYIRDLIKHVTIEYGVNEWVIERNAFQLWLVTDPEINTFLQNRGVTMTAHQTGTNKQDPDFGVATLAPLFGTYRRINEGAGREVHNKDNLIRLPDSGKSEGIKALVEQLIQWVPGLRGTQLRMDGPMALWFWELAARRILGWEKVAGEQRVSNHLNRSAKYMTRRQLKQRHQRPIDTTEVWA